MITHNYTVMCDQVRKEDNGKFLLIGVYADTILVSSLPVTLPSLTFFNKLHVDESGAYGIKMRIEKMEGGEPLFRAEGSIAGTQRGPVFVPISTPIQFEQTGPYNFVIEIEGSEPILYSFSVDISPKPIPML